MLIQRIQSSLDPKSLPHLELDFLACASMKIEDFQGGCCVARASQQPSMAFLHACVDLQWGARPWFGCTPETLHETGFTILVPSTSEAMEVFKHPDAPNNPWSLKTKGIETPDPSV